MNIEELKLFLEKEPSFRLKQIYQAVFQHFISSWDEMTNIPKDLQADLKRNFSLDIEGEVFASQDGRTYKALITFSDGEKVEAVLMRNNDGRNSLCVSSQVGCAGGCSFCATGKMGLKRNLTSGEIIDQFLFFARYLKDNFGEKERITNVIFMGMGEPFSNYENVTGAIKVLNSEECVGLGARSISVSTAGIAPGIEKFSEEKGQINLAISLHASNDRLRSRLMPINKHYSIKKILESVDKYISKKNRKVMFEYLMIAGVNDSQECAEELVKLMKKPLYMVNIISYNSTGDFRSSSPGTIKAFKKILLKNGVNVTTRKSFGGDIDAACGQLANKT